jgi:hypothetical protein
MWFKQTTVTLFVYTIFEGVETMMLIKFGSYVGLFEKGGRLKLVLFLRPNLSRKSAKVRFLWWFYITEKKSLYFFNRKILKLLVFQIKVFWFYEFLFQKMSKFKDFEQKMEKFSFFYKNWKKFNFWADKKFKLLSKKKGKIQTFEQKKEKFNFMEKMSCKTSKIFIFATI